MPVRTYLYDAMGVDQEVTLDAERIAGLHDRQLLWIDVAEFEEEELRQVASLLGLNRESMFNLLQPERRPRLDNYGAYFQLNIESIEESDGTYRMVGINFVLCRNLVLTVHRVPVTFIESFDRRIKGDSRLGELDAGAFLAALLDWHVTAYFRIIEQMQVQVDRLDARALRPRHGGDLLADLARLRQRVAFIRRTLTPHREVYAALARPDFQALAGSESAGQYVMLNDRLARAIEAAENARELVVGSFEMFTTQTALRTNEEMKLLTLVSVVLLPANVIIGIASLLLKSPVYAVGTAGFWIMLAAIGLIALSALAYARWRQWL